MSDHRGRERPAGKSVRVLDASGPGRLQELCGKRTLNGGRKDGGGVVKETSHGMKTAVQSTSQKESCLAGHRRNDTTRRVPGRTERTLNKGLKVP